MALDFENRRTGSTAQAQIAAAEELTQKSLRAFCQLL